MSNRTFNLSMSSELVKKIDRQAKRAGSNRSDFIRQAVNKQLNLLEQWENLTKAVRAEYKGSQLTEQQVVGIIRGCRNHETKE